jgi:acetolactate synthase-1/2/3 large subunit
MRGYRKRLVSIQENTLSDADCEAFFELLAKSKRPLIYAGGGVISAGASEALREFAIQFGIPVTTTLMGLGCFDTMHPLALHMLGMHGLASANFAVDDCDFLIAVGARFDDRVAGRPNKFAPNAGAIAHFDIDPSEIHKVKPADWFHVGLMKEALETLSDYGNQKALKFDREIWHAEIAELKRQYGLNYDRDSEAIQPYYIIETMNSITRGEAVISTGVGQHQMWAAQYCDFREPRLWLTSGSMGTMGFGLPAALGAQFACPDKLVIDIDGDASIRMNLGELETATTYNLPVKVIVLNNYGDGMVMQWQRLFHGGRLSGSTKLLRKKDFIRTAEADGFGYAKRLERKEDVPHVLQEFLSYPGPAFLEVIIDPEADVYPMVAPGMTYRDIVTGEHIPNRYADDNPDDDGSAGPGQSEMF